MIFTSTEFEEALESEIDRLVREEIAEYEDSDEFCERLNKAVQAELDNMWTYLLDKCRSVDTLQIFFSTPETSEKVGGRVDIENIIEQEIEEMVAEDNVEGLQFIQTRLDIIQSKVREALLHTNN